MNTPTTQTPAQIAEQFRNEVRQALKTIQSRIEQTTNRIMMIESIQADERNTLDELTKAIETMLHGIKQAANATAPAQVGTFSEMTIDTIIMSYDDNGKPAYKGLGAPFQKFGVRIWNEVLPIFADPASLKPGKNSIQPTPARVLMTQGVPEEGKTAQPRKVTGKV